MQIRAVHDLGTWLFLTTGGPALTAHEVVLADGANYDHICRGQARCAFLWLQLAVAGKQLLVHACHRLLTCVLPGWHPHLRCSSPAHMCTRVHSRCAPSLAPPRCLPAYGSSHTLPLSSLALRQVHVPGLAWGVNYSAVPTNSGVVLLWSCGHKSLLQHPRRRPAILAAHAAFFSCALNAPPSAAAQLQSMELMSYLDGVSRSELSLSNQ